MAALMKFDTLSWAKKLEKAGVPPKQAEVQVELIFKAINDNICTKQDLRESEGNITLKLKELELNFELKIEQVKSSLQKQIAGWVLGVSAVQATLIIGVIRYIH